MSQPVVYVALHQFCESDSRPRQRLLEAGFDVRANTSGRRPKREELLTALQHADAVLAGVEPYDGELLAQLPRLRCISRCGVGTDAIDLQATERLKIAVLTTPEEVIAPVAEMTLAMMLALARNLPWHQAQMREGRWSKRSGHLLAEWTIGLIGFGRIGRAVERLLRPFSCRVLVADPAASQANVPPGVQVVPLADVLGQADLVSLHVSRPQADGPLLAARELGLMKPGSVLVNTARGFLVDERALLETLTAGRLAGAAVDVFDVEPYTGPLARLPNVLCTPHVGSSTVASRAAMELRCAEQIVEQLSQS